MSKPQKTFDSQMAKSNQALITSGMLDTFCEYIQQQCKFAQDQAASQVSMQHMKKQQTARSVDRIGKTLVNNIVDHCMSWLPDQQFALQMIKEISSEFQNDDYPNQNDEGCKQGLKDKNNLLYEHLTPMGPDTIQQRNSPKKNLEITSSILTQKDEKKNKSAEGERLFEGHTPVDWKAVQNLSHIESPNTIDKEDPGGDKNNTTHEVDSLVAQPSQQPQSDDLFNVNPSFISPQDEIGANFCAVLGTVVENDICQSNDAIVTGQEFERQRLMPEEVVSQQQQQLFGADNMLHMVNCGVQDSINALKEQKDILLNLHSIVCETFTQSQMVNGNGQNQYHQSVLFENPLNQQREAQSTLVLLDKVLDKLDINRIDQKIDKIQDQYEVSKNQILDALNEYKNVQDDKLDQVLRILDHNEYQRRRSPPNLSQKYSNQQRTGTSGGFEEASNKSQSSRPILIQEKQTEPQEEQRNAKTSFQNRQQFSTSQADLNSKLLQQSSSSFELQRIRSSFDENDRIEEEIKENHSSQIQEEEVFIPTQDKKEVSLDQATSAKDGLKFQSTKLYAQSFARYIQISQSAYEIPWQSTFVCQPNPEVVLVRGKHQTLDIVDANKLQQIRTVETKGHGIFCCWTDPSTQRALIGCHEGHLFTLNLSSLGIIENCYLKLRQGIYSIVQLPDHPQIVMCLQHFGFVDFVSIANNSLELLHSSSTQLPTNTVYDAFPTLQQKNSQNLAKKPCTTEFALSTYSGLRFIQVWQSQDKSQKKGAEINQFFTLQSPSNQTYMQIKTLNEIYLKDKQISSMKEYAEGLYVVCVARDSMIYLIDRKRNGVIQKIRNPSGRRTCYQITPIPGFDVQEMPFLLMRDDKNLYLVSLLHDQNSQEEQCFVLMQAAYENQQSYQSMVVVERPQLEDMANIRFVTQDKNTQEQGTSFSLLLLTHKPDQSSKVMRLDFDQSFIDAVKEKLVDPSQIRKVLQ